VASEEPHIDIIEIQYLVVVWLEESALPPPRRARRR
jgi:hypothetical protein